MNIVNGINPKTNKKETYRFNNNDDGFWKAQDKVQELEKEGYKKVDHTGETLLSKLLEV